MSQSAVSENKSRGVKEVKCSCDELPTPVSSKQLSHADLSRPAFA